MAVCTVPKPILWPDGVALCVSVSCFTVAQGRPTTVHLHGGASLAPYDGWAEDVSCGGESKDYYYANRRPALEWYHDHVLEITTGKPSVMKQQPAAALWMVGGEAVIETILHLIAPPFRPLSCLRTTENSYYGLSGMYTVHDNANDGGCGEPWVSYMSLQPPVSTTDHGPVTCSCNHVSVRCSMFPSIRRSLVRASAACWRSRPFALSLKRRQPWTLAYLACNSQGCYRMCHAPAQHRCETGCAWGSWTRTVPEAHRSIHTGRHH